MFSGSGRAVSPPDALVKAHILTMGERLTGFVHVLHLQILTAIAFIITWWSTSGDGVVKA